MSHLRHTLVQIDAFCRCADAGCLCDHVLMFTLVDTKRRNVPVSTGRRGAVFSGRWLVMGNFLVFHQVFGVVLRYHSLRLKWSFPLTELQQMRETRGTDQQFAFFLLFSAYCLSVHLLAQIPTIMSFAIFYGNWDFKAMSYSRSKFSLESDCLPFNLLETSNFNKCNRFEGWLRILRRFLDKTAIESNWFRKVFSDKPKW